MSSAEPDGTEVLVSTASTVVPYLLDMPAVQYDFNRLRPILANGTGAVVYARTAAGVDGVEDLVDRERPLVFGGIAATSLDVTTLWPSTCLAPTSIDLRLRGTRPGQPGAPAR